MKSTRSMILQTDTQNPISRSFTDVSISGTRSLMLHAGKHQLHAILLSNVVEGVLSEAYATGVVLTDMHHEPRIS